MGLAAAQKWPEIQADYNAQKGAVIAKYQGILMYYGYAGAAS
jgi:hypothetical protein